MNSWKYYVGNTLNIIERSLIFSKNKYIDKTYPYGRNWIYDLKRIIRNNPSTIIDAGANVGSVSKDLNNFFPDSTIYSFEPVNKTYQLLAANVSHLKQIIPVSLALGAENKKTLIQINPENTINSLKVEVNPTQESEEIEIVRLDDFMKNKVNSKIDILKIDVEGFEFEVLEGCGALEIDYIFLEVGYNKNPTKVYFTEVDNYLKSKGYCLLNIYDLMRNNENRMMLDYSNNLYIKADLLA
ncbi:MAG: FkbM family methyltransferase [Pedobacter sp.]|nr:MAG: FkbM family methyltransferase [Pedobacter sp.]